MVLQCSPPLSTLHFPSNLGITKDGLKKPSWIGVASKLQSQLSAEIYQVVRAYRLLMPAFYG